MFCFHFFVFFLFITVIQIERKVKVRFEAWVVEGAVLVEGIGKQYQKYKTHH